MNEEQRKELERKISVMQAYLDGADIEFTANYPDIEWGDIANPFWDWVNSDYRVKQTLPTINWDHVAPEYKWLATDKDGKLYLYKSMPTQGNKSCGFWVGSDKDFPIDVDFFASFNPGTCNWEDSLVERPRRVQRRCSTCKHSDKSVECTPCSACLTNNTYEGWEPKS